jgi:hypothetical protein
MSDSRSKIGPARPPWEPTPEQVRQRQHFQAQHPEVGFRRASTVAPSWEAYWAAGDGTVQGRASHDFGSLLAEVFAAFNYQDVSDEAERSGAG